MGGAGDESEEVGVADAEDVVEGEGGGEAEVVEEGGHYFGVVFWRDELVWGCWVWFGEVFGWWIGLDWMVPSGMKCFFFEGVEAATFVPWAAVLEGSLDIFDVYFDCDQG